MPDILHQTPRFLVLFLLLIGICCQSGCIVISTTGAIAATAVNTTVSVAGHTVKTAVDVVTPDGDDED